MNKAFEKILDRLEELQNNLLSQTEGDINLQVGVINGVMHSKEIVQEGWWCAIPRYLFIAYECLSSNRDKSARNILRKSDLIFQFSFYYSDDSATFFGSILL